MDGIEHESAALWFGYRPPLPGLDRPSSTNVLYLPGNRARARNLNRQAFEMARAETVERELSVLKRFRSSRSPACSSTKIPAVLMKSD